MKYILLAILTGLAAGLLGALCGVGGGIIMVPAFAYLLGMEQKAAIATSMAVIVPTSLMAIARFQQAGLVQWNVFWPTALGAILAAYFATGWVKKLGNDQLTKVFAVLMILVGISMLFKKS